MFTAEEHFDFFTEFCAKTIRMGGATPHLTMVGETLTLEGVVGLTERLWRGGCYAATYNFASAEKLWTAWRLPDVLARPGEFYGWVEKAWPELPLRKERKAVNNTLRFTTCVLSYAEWALAFQKQIEDGTLNRISPVRQYEAVWAYFTDNVKYMGRYIGIRALEYLRRYITGCERLIMPDIRPVDAIYPRRSLALMFPEYIQALNGNNADANVSRVNQCASEIRDYVNGHGVEMDFYTMQSLLCEYKKSVQGARQYPGRSVDSELMYLYKTYGEVPPTTSLFHAVRARLFPHEGLGELNGWDNTRDELGRVFAEYGYIWSDLEYDYTKSKERLNSPVLR